MSSTATDTSAGSFVSFRIYEQAECITAPGDNALWFMYEPVLMSKKSFDKLNKQQQDVIIAAGKKAQAYLPAAMMTSCCCLLSLSKLLRHQHRLVHKP